ncbi:Mitochondrial hypoxia responsive domain containing protein [Rutstroemia sp. NJR-2017a WRK4]|nr:Mitochondrial hypoxia responsive domain containing protein [Rutstroemia sp. NJR-2017a WRK4]
MKILTKEEEQAHYNATLKGGITGGVVGLALGGAAVYAANARFHTIRNLTLPMKTFLVTSSGTFAAIIQADRASRSFEWNRDPSRKYKDQASRTLEEQKANESTMQRLKDWGRENRYPIVTASWVASMGIALGLVGRNPYLSGAQKLVQARVYAQGLTLAVLVATAAFEMGDAKTGKGRWETVKVIDPNDPEHKHLIEKRIHHEAYEGEDLWRDMVDAEERRMKSRQASGNKSTDHGKKSDDPHYKEHNKHLVSDKTPRGTENKHKIATEMKSAGKVDYDEAEEKERKNMERQTELETANRKEGRHPEPKVTDRNAAKTYARESVH